MSAANADLDDYTEVGSAATASWFTWDRSSWSVFGVAHLIEFTRLHCGRKHKSAFAPLQSPLHLKPSQRAVEIRAKHGLPKVRSMDTLARYGTGRILLYGPTMCGDGDIRFRAAGIRRALPQIGVPRGPHFADGCESKPRHTAPT